MRRTTVRIAPRSVFGHPDHSSMILFPVDATGILAIELKRDAPRAVDMHRVACRVEPCKPESANYRPVAVGSGHA